MTGALIRRAREALGMSLRELAAEVGCREAYLGEIERGVRRVMAARYQAAVARALGVENLDALADLPPPPPPKALPVGEGVTEMWGADR